MDWKTTALVVIDMENAFISKESPLCIQEAAKSGIRRLSLIHISEPTRH